MTMRSTAVMTTATDIAMVPVGIAMVPVAIVKPLQNLPTHIMAGDTAVIRRFAGSIQHNTTIRLGVV